ncbi:MAG TPA: hypothetical protein VNE63_06205 [Candidatus Acidoferrales bacterium]|nr:hypothetical protein [Candidatus Acidoferrales bacterium]
MRRRQTGTVIAGAIVTIAGVTSIVSRTSTTISNGIAGPRAVHQT